VEAILRVAACGRASARRRRGLGGSTLEIAADGPSCGAIVKIDSGLNLANIKLRKRALHF